MARSPAHLAAEVAWRANQLPSWLALGGTLPYLLGVVQTLRHYQSPRMRISLDGERTLDKPVFVQRRLAPSRLLHPPYGAAFERMLALLRGLRL